MPLPLTVSCFSKIQIGFTFLVPAHLGSPGKRAVKRVCVCVSGLVMAESSMMCEHIWWLHASYSASQKSRSTILLVQHAYNNGLLNNQMAYTCVIIQQTEMCLCG